MKEKLQAVILAGGKGTRLKPYTTNFPKPLMPVGDKPILEIIIHKLKNNGITDIIFSTGHLEELIRAYFGNGEKFGVKITYYKEDKPLGTAGSVRLFRDKLKTDFILMNGDVISDMNFNDLYSFHKANKNLITVTLSERNDEINYGVVETDSDNQITNWLEKPRNKYHVSTGIYMVSPAALEYLPGDETEYFTFPEWVIKLVKAKKKTGSYVHKGYWLDIGRPEDYEKACNDIDKYNFFK